SGAPHPQRRRLPEARLSVKLAIAVVLGAILSLSVAWWMRAVEGERALADADAAIAAGDALEAIARARAAAEARCPGCGSPAAGYARLTTIARDAEARADDGTAFAAWRAVRAASLGSAVLGQATS